MHAETTLPYISVSGWWAVLRDREIALVQVLGSRHFLCCLRSRRLWKLYRVWGCGACNGLQRKKGKPPGLAGRICGTLGQQPLRIDALRRSLWLGGVLYQSGMLSPHLHQAALRVLSGQAPIGSMCLLDMNLQFSEIRALNRLALQDCAMLRA